MKPLNVELLLSHASGISLIITITEKELLDNYLKAIDLLTISYDNNGKATSLQKQFQEQKEDFNLVTRKIIGKDRIYRSS